MQAHETTPPRMGRLLDLRGVAEYIGITERQAAAALWAELGSQRSASAVGVERRALALWSGQPAPERGGREQ